MYFVVYNCVTGITDDYYTNNKIKIFPNPAKDIVNVQIRGVVDNSVQISLYKSDGSLCKTQKANTSLTKINVKDLPKGLYYIKVEGEGFIKTEKVVIN